MNILVLVVVTSVSWLFFFKQKTAYEMRISDWSSDVCSSDLPHGDQGVVSTSGSPSPRPGTLPAPSNPSAARRMVSDTTRRGQGRGVHLVVPDLAAVAGGGVVADGTAELGQELFDRRVLADLAVEVHGPRGVAQDLDGLDAGDVVEEPAARRVTEQPAALRLEVGSAARRGKGGPVV